MAECWASRASRNAMSYGSRLKLGRRTFEIPEAGSHLFLGRQAGPCAALITPSRNLAEPEPVSHSRDPRRRHHLLSHHQTLQLNGKHFQGVRTPSFVEYLGAVVVQDFGNDEELANAIALLLPRLVNRVIGLGSERAAVEVEMSNSREGVVVGDDGGCLIPARGRLAGRALRVPEGRTRRRAC